MADVTMNEAIYTTPDKGDEEPARQIIQARITGEALKPGNVYYDANTHQGHLTCRYCDAVVTHVKETPSIAGDNLGGSSAHFRSLSTHDSSCSWEIKPGSKAKSKIDKTKGYKFHWNSLARPTRSRRSVGHVYVRGEDHKIQTLVADLSDRQSKNFSSLDELVTEIIKSDLLRLKDSVVVRHNHIIPWDEFLVRYQRPNEVVNRFAQLANALQITRSRPALVEIFNTEAVNPSSRSRQGLCAVSREVFLYEDHAGRPNYLIPKVWLDSREVENAMRTKGSYLILGQARLGRESHEMPDRVNHFLNISVASQGQIKKLALKDIVDQMNIPAPQ